jgi:hypothetical protein
LPVVAETLVGALSGIAGVTVLDANDTGPVVSAVVAVTVNEYAVPLVSPVTVAVKAPLDQLAVALPGLVVIV